MYFKQQNKISGTQSHSRTHNHKPLQHVILSCTCNKKYQNGPTQGRNQLGDSDNTIDQTCDLPCTLSFIMLTYDSIEEDIVALMGNILDNVTQSHVSGMRIKSVMHHISTLSY